MLIRPCDRGLLSFRHRGRLFQCLTLNFGARVSSFYRARGWTFAPCAKTSRPGPPFRSYTLMPPPLSSFCFASKFLGAGKKRSLAPTLVTIGWQLDFTCFTVRLDLSKVTRMIVLAKSVLANLPTLIVPSETWNALLGSCFGFRPCSTVSVPLWIPVAYAWIKRRGSGH